MPGTIEGAAKAMKTIKEIYGQTADGRSLMHVTIGSLGGKNGTTGGFASNKKGPDGLTGRQRASFAGAKGGTISKRTGILNGEGKHHVS